MKFSHSKHAARKDTGAWIMLTWLAFLAAVGTSFFGILTLPGDIWMKGYLFISLSFMLSCTFTLSKTLRDNQTQKVDTSQWVFQVWTAFLLSGGMSFLGVINLAGEPIYKGFAFMSLLFALSSSFTLAKTIRDNHEAQLFMQADLNQDGQLSEQEAKGSSFESRFKQQDLNRDGFLSTSEVLKR